MSLGAAALPVGSSDETSADRWVVRHSLLGGARVDPIARDETGQIVSFFKGDRDDWQTGLPTFAEIVYPNVYEGIDIVYSATGKALTYDFVVHPGADPDDIGLAWRGAGDPRITADGDLQVPTPLGSFIDEAPFTYQRVDGHRREVPSRFELSRRGYGFALGSYDETRRLVIDPVVVIYAGYIGGAGGNEAVTGIAVDSTGSAYVAGFTDSPEGGFPETVGPDLSFNAGTWDAFVAKVSPDGSALEYAGYIGGAGRDEATGIAVDSTGSAYVSGFTNSDEASFPETVGPDLSFNGGTFDAFAAKLSPDGSALMYAGYVGGSGLDQANGIAVDSAGNAYLAGAAASDEATFPETGGPDLSFNGGSSDAFVAKVTTNGSALAYAGYIGGLDLDTATGIAVDPSGSAYVAGATNSDEGGFPEVVGPDTTYNQEGDAFVAKLAGDGSALVYAGYIGGSDSDYANGIAVDSAGNAYVAGTTNSDESGFPETVGPDTTYNQEGDGFVAKLAVDGSALVYAGFIGGADGDQATGIAVDSSGNAYVTGATSSDEVTFPVIVGPDPTFAFGLFDAFVAKVAADGTALGYSGYIGGTGFDRGTAIAVDSAGGAYVGGHTGSTQTTFPVSGGPSLIHSGGAYDPFVSFVQDPCIADPDAICGDAGDNDLQGTSEDDDIYAGGGNDTIDGGGGNDTIIGEGGNDIILGGQGDDVVIGGDGDDVLIGDDLSFFPSRSAQGLGGNDLLDGGGGLDQLYAGGGIDKLIGGAGADVMSGEAQIDELLGGGGRDEMDGGTENDDLKGGGGPDRLSGGPGRDALNGGPGKDVCFIGKKERKITSCESTQKRNNQGVYPV